MKIAYLILAHSNFKHLNLLLEELSGPDDYIVLHLDKKIRKLPTLPEGLKNFTLIQNRVRPMWASYGMVEAINVLLKTAYQTTDADYFITLSGVDFPVKSKRELKDFLKNKGEYINMVKGTPEWRPESWFNKYYFTYERRARSHPVTKFYNYLETYVNKFYRRTIPFQLYTGLDWFALSRQTVQHILTTIEQDKKYDKFFRNTYSPIEAYYQTILGNSGMQLNIQPSLTYTDWTKPEKPAYMQDEHVEYFKTNSTHETPYGLRHFFFARKFHDGTLEVAKRISNELLKTNE